MSAAFVTERVEVARWGAFRLVRDTMRENRRRGEPDRGDFHRHYVCLVNRRGTLLRVAKVDNQSAHDLAEGHDSAREAIERAFEKRAARDKELKGRCET